MSATILPEQNNHFASFTGTIVQLLQNAPCKTVVLNQHTESLWLFIGAVNGQ